MIRTQFVALGGFALAVVCSAGLGIASTAGDYPPMPDDAQCDVRTGKDPSKLRVEVAGPDGDVLRDRHGNPHTVPMCPEPPPHRPGTAPEGQSANCTVETGWRGARGKVCEVEDCRFEVDANAELVEVCEGPPRQRTRD